MARAAAVIDYRELARRRLPPFLFEYVDGGSYAETTLRRNTAGLAAAARAADVSSVDPSCTLLGNWQALPVVLGPIGLAGMIARRGEVQAIRAAGAANVPFCLSTVSACPIAEVSAAASQPFWFQLYMLRDRGFKRDLLARARAAGCSALVFTVDMPVAGTRYRDQRSGLANAFNLHGQLRRFWQVLTHPAWAWDVGLWGRPHQIGNVAPLLGRNSGLRDYFGWIGGNFDPSIGWSDLDFVREHWNGPLVIKGILDAEDARAAVGIGADGIVVSNHGGRQLDGVPSTARALPAIADAVRGEMAILADGGVRSGLDVIRMLALDADAVMLGRAWVYALAAGGERGVTHVLSLIDAELRVAMALTGCNRLADIDRSS